MSLWLRLREPKWYSDVAWWFWRGLLNPASLVAIVAPFIVNRVLWVVQVQIKGDLAPTNPLYAWVTDPKFLGLGNYAVQIYSAVLSLVFWAYASTPLIKRDAEHHAKRDAKASPVSGSPHSGGVNALYAPLTVSLLIVAIGTLLMGVVGTPSVMDLYLNPAKAWRVVIELPHPQSPLTWIRVMVYLMSAWLTSISDKATVNAVLKVA